MSLFRFLANAMRNAGFGKHAMTSHPGFSAETPNGFTPAASNARELGFLEGGHAPAFAEACTRLNVKPVFTPRPGYGKRSIGAKVVDADGNHRWLKVFGLTTADNERWKAETDSDAIAGIHNPELIEQISWRQRNEFWVARLTEFAAGILEDGPWADAAAHGVTDIWIESLNRSLETLTRQPCTRIHIQPEIFRRWLWRHFRRELPAASSGWVPSHNDLQWSNLSFPDLFILDWEWFGQSPHGYDQGMLIAYSCHDDELTARLERAFEPVLGGEFGHYAKLFAAHTVRNSIRSGWLNPAIQASVERLIGRWEAQLR